MKCQYLFIYKLNTAYVEFHDQGTGFPPYFDNDPYIHTYIWEANNSRASNYGWHTWTEWLQIWSVQQKTVLLGIFHKATTQNLSICRSTPFALWCQLLHGEKFSSFLSCCASYFLSSCLWNRQVWNSWLMDWCTFLSMCNRILVNFMAYVDFGACDCLVWCVWHTCHSIKGLLLALRISFVLSSSANPPHIDLTLPLIYDQRLITSTSITARGNIINIDWFDGLWLLPLYLRRCQYPQHTVVANFTSWEYLVENSWAWQDVCWYL